LANIIFCSLVGYILYRYALFTIITCLDFPNPFTLTTDYTCEAIVFLMASSPQKNLQFISPPKEAGDFLQNQVKDTALALAFITADAVTDRPGP